MARVQQVNQANKKKQPSAQKNVSDKQNKELAKTNPKREPSKNEILFFRIGMSVIALTLITVAIIFTIEYFMNDEEVPGVYDDYISITASDLKYLTYDDGSGVYGDFSYFQGKTDYEELLQLINDNNEIYVYFYRGSDIDEEIKELILSKDLTDKAFFLIDLDEAEEGLAGTEFAHLDLDLTRDNLFLTFDVEAQTFSLEVRVVDIVREIGKL
ncbi:MAG: hypothetical protein C4537_06310 [Acholeplasma sp.]|jgi:hypothetical protein|nr:MAG: hypothetical protein C4537_06310 [Acholeplasma sp.]